MIGWLLLAVFVIIWAAFLLPSWRRSPTSTVEDFEQRMNLLAEANRVSPGRWVLVPKKGHRFLGPQDRQRARLRRRRRFVFVGLLEAIGLTLLMGMFQPFRAILVITVVLACVLVLYVGMLLRFRVIEAGAADGRRAAVAHRQLAYTGTEGSYGSTGGNGYRYDDDVAYGNGNGRAYASNGNGNGHGRGNGYGNGAGNGYADVDPVVFDEVFLPPARYLSDGGIQIIDEDVHVIVRRSDEVDLTALRAANGSSAG